MKKLFQWIGRNEKHLSTAAFVVSFIIDNIGYSRVDLPWVTVLFTAMFLIAAVCVVVSHYLHRDRPDATPSVKHPFYTLLPIIAQFFTGGLLSGCLIFYTRSANIFASWPFILLLATVFLGNEVFSRYRERLTFQTVQLFFALYLYAIFEVPIVQGSMGPGTFLESGAASVIVFGLLLVILWIVGKKRFMQSLRRILIASAVILVVMNAFYFTGILPPLPLALTDAGIYHGVSWTGSGYEVEAEAGAQPLFGPEVIHETPGAPLFAYSAVFAPISLTTPIMHRWQEYENGSWQTVAAITFPVSGGRDSGYRGYSELDTVTPGSWRVSIETLNGSVLGRERFSVVESDTAPTVYSEFK